MMDKQNPDTSKNTDSPSTKEVQQPSSPIKKGNDVDMDSVVKFISSVFEDAFKTFSNSKLIFPLLLVGLVSWLISFGTLLSAVFIVPLLVTIPLNIIYSFSVTSMTLEAATGKTPSINGAMKPVSRSIEYIITFVKILFEFIIRLFKPPYIIPGFKYAIGSWFFMLDNLENDTPNDKAVENSQNIAKGNILNLFFLMLTIVFGNFVLSLIPFVSIITTPFAGLCVAHAYLKLKK